MKVPRIRLMCDPRQLDVLTHLTTALALASKRTNHLLRVRGVFGPLETTPTSSSVTSASLTSSQVTPSSINHHNTPYHHQNTPYHHHHYHHHRPIPMVCNESASTGKDRGVHLLPSLLLPSPLIITTPINTGIGPGIVGGQGARSGQGLGAGVGNGQVAMLLYPSATSIPRYIARYPSQRGYGRTISALVHTFQTLHPNPPSPPPSSSSPCPCAWARALWRHLINLVLSDVRRAR